MKIPVFQLINLGVILVVLAFLVRYAWDLFFGKGYSPVEWEHARKSGQVSRKLLQLEKNYPDKVRFYNWWFQIERLKYENIPGAFAELGVYKGESAAVLHHMAPGRKFHLFDTFSGFPPSDLAHETGEAATYTPDRFSDTHVTEVLRKISGNENIIQHPGGGPKQIALYHNVVVFTDTLRVQYLTDTMPGSSGSPVFDSGWQLVAIHHAGGWLKQPGKSDTRFCNEGIAVNALVDGISQTSLSSEMRNA